MSVKILEVKRVNCPAARLIGKRYTDSPNWSEWWENNWFAELEKLPAMQFNTDAYIGGVHIVGCSPEYWIGMLFPFDTEAPVGFDYIDIEPLDYAVFYLYGDQQSGDFYTMDTHDKCLEKLREYGFMRKENDWCFERYNCPRFTSPDADGNVILDYAISIE